MTTDTDTAPNSPPSPESIDGYEPPIDGESQREKRNRKARNRRRAEKVTADASAESGPAPTGRPRKANKRADSVTGIVSGVGIAVMAFDQTDGLAIIEGAADLGQALANLADKNPKVARALDALNETSSWAEVAIAVGGIVVPIVQNHGLFARGEQTSVPAPPKSNTEPNTPAPADAPQPNGSTITTDAAGGLIFAARPDA